MLIVTAAMAIAVYEWVGLELLRRAWINVDLVWTWALGRSRRMAAAGVVSSGLDVVAMRDPRVTAARSSAPAGGRRDP